MKLGDIIIDDLRQLRYMELLRANSVQRFSMSPMTRDQTIAAHQWDVAMIFLWLSRFIRDPDAVRQDQNGGWLLTGILLALSHDMGEVFTGDAPAPFKRAYKLVIDDELPMWVARMLTAWKFEPVKPRDVVIRTIVKVCDLISTHNWASNFGNFGDPYAERMAEQLEKELDSGIRRMDTLLEEHGYSIDPYWREKMTVTEVSGARNVWDLIEEEREEYV